MQSFNSLDVSTKCFLIVMLLLFIGMIYIALDNWFGVYHEQELERGSIEIDGIIIGYYRIVKLFYGDGTTKIKTERIKLP